VEIVLGVSMTPTTVRMVLVEGAKADGVTIDHDVFDLTSVDGSATSSASDQVLAAVLGTQESAAHSGHRLMATGVTWSDHANAAELREALAARRIEDVILVSELHAAGALAQAVGRAVGYERTALMLVDRDSATLSVVESSDGSIVKVDTRSLHSDDAMAVIGEMAAGLEGHPAQPQGMFVLGSGVDVTAVKEYLEQVVAIPVSAPEEPEMALARGAALASASAPLFDASTVGLAYSQDPDGTTAGEAYAVGLAAADTQLGYAAVAAADEPEPLADEPESKPEERKPFMLVGSTMASIFVVGVVALVISLAVSIRPTVDSRPSPSGDNAVQHTTAAPPAVQDALPVGPPPAPETIQAPVPAAAQQQAPAPRAVVVQDPPPQQAPAPVPEAPPPAPAAPPVVDAPIAPPPAPVPAYVPPAPVYVPPAPVYVPPAPIYIPPVVQLPSPWRPRWQPPASVPQSPPTYVPQTPPTYEPQTPPTYEPQTPPQSQFPPSRSGGSGGSGSSGLPGLPGLPGGSGGSGGSPSIPLLPGSGSGGSRGSGGSGGGGGHSPTCSILGCY
jgi:uncharacterized membrane protein YgcG